MPVNKSATIDNNNKAINNLNNQVSGVKCNVDLLNNSLATFGTLGDAVLIGSTIQSSQTFSFDLSQYRYLVVVFQYNNTLQRQHMYSTNTLVEGMSYEDGHYASETNKIGYAFSITSNSFQLSSWSMDGWTFNYMHLYAIK